MALINCSECGKEISEKAISCPNCGNPISQTVETIKTESKQLLKFPQLPTNLEIGKQIVNWGGNSAFNGFYDQRENIITEIPSGKIAVTLHTHGISIIRGLTISQYPIHNSQIISLKQTSQEELSKIDKSVIGRAVVGGLILGPLGAIVGGMSGIGSKEKFMNKHYLVINYWDIKTNDAQSLLISGDKTLIQSFIKRHEKEKTINETENRKPEKNDIPISVYIFILLIIIPILIMMVKMILS